MRHIYVSATPRMTTNTNMSPNPTMPCDRNATAHGYMNAISISKTTKASTRRANLA